MSEPVAIPTQLDGERIDRAVSFLTGRARAEVSELIAKGGVRLAGAVVTVRHRRVAAGEVLEVDLAPDPTRDVLEPAPEGSVIFRVVFEDASIIIVDKPAGLVVHPGAGHREDTLAAGLLARYPDLAEAARQGAADPSRPGIVHRLDKDTSGLMVVARTASAYEALAGQLASRSMGRTYRALALGNVLAEEGVIEAPIGRSARTPTRMAVSATGRWARSTYRVQDRFRHPIETTLLEVSLDTGRTHQIRVHLAAIGHAVAGDRRYGGTRAALQLPRPFLHAERLRLIHPLLGDVLEWEAPLPPDLAAVLASLEH